ncbi:MAG: tetratricopeptide repeat protein [Flavobacteriaceae bacterium]|nr:tetratricopeptide repeat protein [Flavobacteriaceae bacterium]
MKLLVTHKILFIIFVFIGLSHAQNSKLDALYIKEKDSIGKLARSYYYLDFDKAIALHHENAKLMKKHHDTLALIRLDNELLWLFTARMGNLDSTSVYIMKMENHLPKIKDSVVLGSAYTRIGFGYQIKGYYRTAMENYLSSVDVKEQLPEHASLGFSYNLVGKIYELQNQYENSIKFHRKAAKIRSKVEDKNHLAHSYTNMGIVYRKANQLDSALYYIQRAIEIRKENLSTITRKRQFATTLKCRGYVFIALKRYHEAISDFEEAISIVNESDGKYVTIESYTGLLASYIELDSDAKAYEALLASKKILKEYPIKDLQVINYDLESQYYYKTGNYKKAYRVNQKRDSLNQEIRNENILKNTEELQAL